MKLRLGDLYGPPEQVEQPIFFEDMSGHRVHIDHEETSGLDFWGYDSGTRYEFGILDRVPDEFWEEGEGEQVRAWQYEIVFEVADEAQLK